METMALFRLAILATASALVVDRTATPPMGWNSYNHYSCYADERAIKGSARAMVDLGLAAAGYTYVVPDCGWSAKERTADGQITWNTTFYPGGYPALIDYVHGLGLKFGVYSGAGTWECHPEGANYLIQASLGHEQRDAETFAAWGGDYLKYDNCWADGKTFVEYYPNEPDPSARFAAMAAALASVDREIVYAVCQWGIGEDVPEWAGRIANSWRMSNDIINNWISVFRIANQVVPMAKYAGPGHYNDMDMLMIGNGVLTFEESKTHFTLWCIEKSLLMIGSGLEKNLLDPTALTILSNKELIAINQDALGAAAQLVRRFTEEQYDIWAGNLSDSRTVLTVVNWSPVVKVITVNLADAGIQSAGKARDVWAATDLGGLDGVYTAVVPGHGVKLLVLEQTVPAGTYINRKYIAANTTTTFQNMFAITSSEYSLAVVAVSVQARPRQITIRSGTTTKTISVTGSSYIVPSIRLPAGQNTVQIQDPSGAITSAKLTLTGKSTFYSAQHATIQGSGAVLTKCADPNGCMPTNYKVRNFTAASSLTFSGVSGGTVPGAKMVHLHYVNYDLAFDLAWDGSGTNVLNASFAVNGGRPKMWSFPISGGDWQDAARMGVLLEGFREGAGNVVVVSAPGWRFGPDVVGLDVLA